MLVLDTQAVLWTLDGSRRLGPLARRRIAESAAVHVSAATIFEVTIKSMLGKIKVPADIAELLRVRGLINLPITNDDAHAVSEFPELVRHDPFDRLLVAQAFRTGMDLLTADRVLLGLGRDFIVDATR